LPALFQLLHLISEDQVEIVQTLVAFGINMKQMDSTVGQRAEPFQGITGTGRAAAPTPKQNPQSSLDHCLDRSPIVNGSRYDFYPVVSFERTGEGHPAVMKGEGAIPERRAIGGVVKMIVRVHENGPCHS